MAQDWITHRRHAYVMLLITLAVIIPVNSQKFGREDSAGEPLVGRAKALAAPTGPNALELDGEMKSFFKVGGFRDGVQKAIFDETQGAPGSTDFDDQPPARPSGFNMAYDDNSVVDSRNEVPLWIPPIYRNETEQEKAATATTTPRPTSPPPVSRTLRPLVATGLGAPIPVRTTPSSTLRPVQPLGSPGIQQPQQQFRVQQTVQQPQQRTFVPERPQQPVPQPPVQQFVPQQVLQPVPQLPQQPQQFVPQQTAPPQTFLPQQVQRPVPQPPVQQFVSQQPQPAPPQQPRPFVPQQPAIQRPGPQPVLSTNFPAQPLPQQPFRRPFNQQQPTAPRRPPQLRPVGQQQQGIQQPAAALQPQQPLVQPQNQRPLRPFQPQQPNNFASQTPRNPTVLRTGVCPNTIFYQTVLAAPFELQQVYSHFAMVVSVDQCARTCHEFNCAAAFFDPQTRHCQFNPSTSFGTPPGTCPQWPNPLYRNNIAIGSQAYKIFCVTCQRRRRNNRPIQGQPRPNNPVANRFFNGQQPPPQQQLNNQFNGNRRPAPLVFQTTNHNRFNNNQNNNFQRVSNVAARGVPIEQQPKTIIVDDHFGRERLEPSEADWKSLEELESSDPGATRTTIAPLLSSLRIQPLKKGLVYSPSEEPVKEAPLPQLDGSTTNFKLRDQETLSVEEEGSAPPLGKATLRNTKGVTINREGESRVLVELPSN